MTKEEFYYHLTGTETPKFLSPNEELIITKSLKLINECEEQLSLNFVLNCKCKNQDIRYKAGKTIRP